MCKRAAGILFAHAQGRRVDFHSLRGTLNTHLAGRADPQVRQKIMRHSDTKLTLYTYTDSTLLRVSEAITVLLSFVEDVTLCATNLGVSRQNAAPNGTIEISEIVTKATDNEVISHALTSFDADWR